MPNFRLVTVVLSLFLVTLSFLSLEFLRRHKVSIEQCEHLSQRYADLAYQSHLDKTEVARLEAVCPSEGVLGERVEEEEEVVVTEAVEQPAVTVSPSSPSEGYSYQTVATSRGTFGVHLVKLPLSSVRVETITANKTDCEDNCPIKPLAEYAIEKNAYAAINGTYFCPPDYESCGGKVNSYDFAVFNSTLGKWLSSASLGWSDISLMTFSDGSSEFYRKATDYGGGSVSAGIANFPSLVKEGEIRMNEGMLTSYQLEVRGPRGVLGVGGGNVYLGIVTGATVIDAAYVAQVLGMQDALNLDGGGSSALYVDGVYKFGPGRNLPNAVLLVKK